MASATDLLSKNPLQFSLVVDYLSIGVSFRMAVSILLRTKEHTGLASVGSISEKKDRKSTRLNSSHITPSRMPSSA